MNRKGTLTKEQKRLKKNLQCKIWAKKNPDKIKERNKKYHEYNKMWYIKKKYNINEYFYYQYLNRQENKCAICKEKLKIPHIDHCHKKNEFRGFLCINCNIGLGNFKDNMKILKNAINYLQRFKDGKATVRRRLYQNC